MKLIRPTRAAALLLMALAACSDASAGNAITAADQPAAFNTAPTVTVTNSGGSPLISWGALAGATSYSVVVTVQVVVGRSLGAGLPDRRAAMEMATKSSGCTCCCWQVALIERIRSA